MDEFQCTCCRKNGKPADVYSESNLNEFDELAEKLEAAKESQNLTSDAILDLNVRSQYHDTKQSKSLERERNFSTNCFLQVQHVTTLPVKQLITQCPGNSLDVSLSESLASTRQIISETLNTFTANSFLVLGGTQQGNFSRADNALPNPSANVSSQNDSTWSNLTPVSRNKIKNMKYEICPTTHKEKAGNSFDFFCSRKRYLESTLASSNCGRRDGDEDEAQKPKDYRLSESIYTKDIQSSDCSREKIDSIEEPLALVADTQAAPVTGPSGIQIQSQRKDAKKLFVNDVSGKEFKKNMYEQHKTHTGEKPFECRICNKIFSRKFHLKVHLQAHTGEKPFPCHICDKKFSTKQLLERHLRTHTGEKPFPCYICDKRFSRKHHLECHLLTHTGEKPFPCHICDKRYPKKYNLDCHLLTHTGEKTFACHICHKRFVWKSSLEQHLLTHTR